MKTRMVVFVIGIATTVLGGTTKGLEEDQFQHVRLASYNSLVTARDSSWHKRAITVGPEQIFEN